MSFDLLTIFGAGLLTFLTPCVLPVIPIYLAALVGGDVRALGNAPRRRLLSRALLFSAGFIGVFTAMGVGASSIGVFLAEHRSGLQLVGAALVLGFALKFLGVIQLPWLDGVARADEGRFKTRFGAVNALVMGVVFAAGWSPCVGPVLGSVLTYTASTTASPAAGALYLTIYGLGFAVPLLVIAAFAETGLRALQRIKPHLPRIEKATGAVLLLVAGLLVHDAAIGWQTANATAADVTAEKPGPKPSTSRNQALLTAADPTDADVTAASPAAREPLPLMVELYAQSCPICQRMAPLVQQLVTQCDEKKVRVRQVDVSKPANRHLVQKYRVVGVPTFLFLDEDGQEVARLVGEQTEGTLMQALSALRGEECPGLGTLPREPGAHTDADEVAWPEPDPETPAVACGASADPTALAQQGDASPVSESSPSSGSGAASCGAETL